MQPIVGITDYIISNFLSDWIIAIYHYFICNPYQLNCVASHSLDILFQRNVAISLLMWFIVVFCRFSLFPPRV